jgi:hypothetical protein
MPGPEGSRTASKEYLKQKKCHGEGAPWHVPRWSGRSYLLFLAPFVGWSFEEASCAIFR